MMQVDPMADKYSSLSPYNYAFNDPVYWNDVSGATPEEERLARENKIANDRNIIDKMLDNNRRMYGVIGDDDLNGGESGWGVKFGPGDGGALQAFAAPIFARLENMQGINEVLNFANSADSWGNSNFAHWNSGMGSSVLYGRLDERMPGIDPNSITACEVCRKNYPTSGWGQLGVGFRHVGEMLAAFFSINVRTNDIAQFVFIGVGGEEYSLKKMGNGKLGVIDLNDPNNILSILNFTTGNNLLDVGFGAIGIYESDPRNNWIGSPFDRLYQWTESTPNSGLYFNTYGDSRYNNDYYYEYKYQDGVHMMVPSKIKFHKKD